MVTELDGFTIKNGTADGSNDDGTGGALLASLGTIVDPGPTIKRCKFENSMAKFGGGAIYTYRVGLRIEDCVFVSNSVIGVAGGLGSGDGNGGALSSDRTVEAIRCVFDSNVVKGQGGAVHLQGDSLIVNCRFLRNSAEYSGSVTITNPRGGAMFIDGEATIVNCAFSNNTSDIDGGAIHVGLFGEVTVRDSTLSRNKVPTDYLGGGIYFVDGTGSTIKNSILYDNRIASSTVLDAQFYDDASVFDAGDIEHSCVQNLTPVNNGNTTSNPNLVDPANDDLRLQASSGAVRDVGDKDLLPADDGDADDDDDTGEDLPVDLVQDCRVINGETDMGAYEYRPGELCLGDLNDDGEVDGGDMGILLSNWDCSGLCCIADLNKDGIVDGGDGGILLAEWGECSSSFMGGEGGGPEQPEQLLCALLEALGLAEFVDLVDLAAGLTDAEITTLITEALGL